MSTEMEHLITMARNLRDADRTVAEATAALDAATKQRDNIAEIMLPEAMDALGMTTFTLSDGSKINVKNDILVGISKDNEDVAFRWLREHNAGSLIKRQLTVDFSRGEDAKADAIRDALAKKLKRDIRDKTSVHWQTLKAFCKEALEAGVALPMDVFGVVPQRRAVVTHPAAATSTTK